MPASLTESSENEVVLLLGEGEGMEDNWLDMWLLNTCSSQKMTPELAEKQSYGWSNNLMSSNCLNLRTQIKGITLGFPTPN